MKQCFIFTTLFCLIVARENARSQSNPTPFNLSSGNYSLQSWNATNQAGTYPPNMVFHIFSQRDNNLQPDTANPIGNYTGAYNLTSGTRINGLGTDGFAFLNTSSPGNLGAAVLAINTLGRLNIRISWVAGTLASTFTGFRHYSILLQYRVGTSGPWQTAIIGTDTVQYNANIQGNSVVAETVTMPMFTLPSSCENQPVVQIRWRYYQRYPQTSGNRPQLKVDEILVQSDPNTGIPTKLAITSIVPSSPSVNAPFSVTIQSLNNDNQPRNVQSSTTVTLEVANGTGTLTGTLTSTLQAGTNTLTLTGVVYSTAESNVQLRVRRTAGDSLADGISTPFTVLPAASQLTVESLVQYNFSQLPLPTFTVTARRSDGSVDTHFPYQCTVIVQSGPGIPSGTTTAVFTNGVALFNNLIFVSSGTYQIAFRASNPSALTSSNYTLTIVAHPTITEIILPQYMLSSNASTRVPVWALVRLENLQPNTTYRYYTGADSISQVTTTIGAGNNLHYNANTQTFNYTSTRDFTIQGGYSEFRTGPGQTSKTLWLNLVATANVRFTEGNTMYWLVTILDSNRSIQTRMVTTQGTKALYFGTTSNKVSGMVDSASGLAAKSIICLYDDITGTTRPVATAIVQDEGTAVTSAAPFYAGIDNLSGAFGLVVPNAIQAIRRIEVRDLQTGSLLRSFTDTDGIWGQADTRNPASGITASSIHTPRIDVLTRLDGQSICMTGPLSVNIFVRGVDSARIELIKDSDPSVPLMGGITSGTHTIQLDIPESLAGSSNTYLRIVDVDRPDVQAITGPFTLNTPPHIIAQSESITPCLGDSVTLIVLAAGTNLRYQWEKDGQPLAGATSSTLKLSYVNERSSGIYRCRISGAGTCGNDTSNTITIAVRPTLAIARHPGIVYAGLGKTAQLTIETSTTDPEARYQWYRASQPILDNNRITGSQTPTLIIRNVSRSDYDTTYYCIVTTRCGSVRSNNGELRFTGIELFATSDTLIVCPGSTVELRISARSVAGGQLQFQWRRNGSPLPSSSRIVGITSDRLTISRADSTDIGVYTCVVSDPTTGEVRESPHKVLILRAPTHIITQMQDTTICPNQTLRLSLKVNNAARFTLLRGDSVIGDFTNLPPDTVLSAGIDALRLDGSGDIPLRIRVASECDTIFTRPFTVRLLGPPRIIAQPRSQVQLLEGSTLVLSIEVQSQAGEEVRYRWYKDGTPLPDSIASGPILTIPNAQVSHRGQYYCVVTNRCGDTTISSSANVDVISSIAELISSSCILYPLPASTILSITANSDYDALEIVNTLGRVVVKLSAAELAASSGSEVTISVSGLPTGVYKLILYKNLLPVTYKPFIIQR